MAAHGDGEFAAGQDRYALPLRARFKRQLRVIGGDVARLALEIGAELDDPVAGVVRQVDRRIERCLWPRDQFEPRARKGAIARLAAFVAGVIERASDGVVDLEAIFGDNGTRVN